MVTEDCPPLDIDDRRAFCMYCIIFGHDETFRASVLRWAVGELRAMVKVLWHGYNYGMSLHRIDTRVRHAIL